MIASEGDAELETCFRLGTVLGDHPGRETRFARKVEASTRPPIGTCFVADREPSPWTAAPAGRRSEAEATAGCDRAAQVPRSS